MKEIDDYLKMGKFVISHCLFATANAIKQIHVKSIQVCPLDIKIISIFQLIHRSTLGFPVPLTQTSK